MNKRICKDCFWEGRYCFQEDCEDYNPLEDDAEMEKYIEERRLEFYREWVMYLAEED